MSGKQHLRHFFSMPFFRSAVLGIFQKISGKRFRLSGFLIIQNSWYHSGNGIHHNHSRKFPTSKYIITDRNIIRHNFFQNTLINSLIMTAEKNQVFFQCELFRHILVESFSLRSKKDHTWFSSDALYNGFIGQIYRFCLHQHSGTAAIWIIIYLLVLVEGKIPDIDRFQ